MGRQLGGRGCGDKTLQREALLQHRDHDPSAWGYPRAELTHRNHHAGQVRLKPERGYTSCTSKCLKCPSAYSSGACNTRQAVAGPVSSISPRTKISLKIQAPPCKSKHMYRPCTCSRRPCTLPFCVSGRQRRPKPPSPPPFRLESQTMAAHPLFSSDGHFTYTVRIHMCRALTQYTCLCGGSDLWARRCSILTIWKRLVCGGWMGGIGSA